MHSKRVSTKQILYYTDLICGKIDLHTDAFIKRLDALLAGDKEKVEFIEKMMLEPLDAQIHFLAVKASKLFRKESI